MTLIKLGRSGRASRAALLGATAALAACSSFGPSRQLPAVVAPAHYAVADLPNPLPDADGATQHLEWGAQAVPEWWKTYGSAPLNALVAEGLVNNASLAAAQSTLAAAREGLRSQIGQSLWPSVDVGFDPSRQRALALPTFVPQTFLYNVFAAEVKTSYTFDFFGAAVLADRSLGRQVQQQAFQLQAVRRALAANIVLATINSASLNEQVIAITELVALSERRAAQTAARYALGSVSRDELLAAQHDAANAAARCRRCARRRWRCAILRPCSWAAHPTWRRCPCHLTRSTCRSACRCRFRRICCGSGRTFSPPRRRCAPLPMPPAPLRLPYSPH